MAECIAPSCVQRTFNPRIYFPLCVLHFTISTNEFIDSDDDSFMPKDAWPQGWMSAPGPSAFLK